MNPLVAYGSTMHQSENIAKQIASHFKVEAVELNKVTNEQLSNTKFAIFVIATFGNGMFPQNSKQFAESLSYSDVDLSNLQFAELALGSNHYQFFCRAGEELNKMLTEHGAKEIIPYVRSDKCEKDYGESVIENFKRDVCSIKIDGNGQPIPPAKSGKKPESKSTLPLIAYGSTMGASTKIAKRIASEFGTEAVELNSVQLDDLEKSNFAIFVVSTFGDGELPDNAIEFAERLRSSSVNLGYLQFALLGLGSTKYKKFCAAANEIHDLLTEHGAKDVIPYVKSDKKASDQGSSVIEKFVTDSCKVKIPQSAPMNIYGDDLLIAYGSTMHSSEKIAKRIAENFGIEAVELNSISINQLGNAKLAIFVVATIGEGRYPKNCQEFADRLTSSNVNLNNLKYALLGLGSTYYKDFCKAAISIEKLLKNHGAKPLFQLVKSNKASPDQGKSDIANFEKRVIELKSVVEDNSTVKPLVAYGSTRHKAEKIAKAIAEQYGAEAVELNNVTENDIAISKICIIVISTINDGDFPQNSRDFCQKLCSDSSVDLRGVQFALLGLGSSYYEKFCRASENLNKALLDHGAKPLVPYLKSDKATEDNGDGTINEFIDSVSKAMKSIRNPSEQSKLEIKEIGTVPKGKDANEIIAADNFIIVDIKSKVLLSDEGYDPQLLCYTLAIPSSITYNPGDYCLIRPQNDPQIVSDVISTLKLNPNQIIEINAQGMNSGLWPKSASINQLFSQFIDLNAKPSQALYKLVGASNMVTSATVYDLIINNSSSTPELRDLLLLVTPIEPRTYSISSYRKGELTLIIGSVIVDENHHGLCTHYLRLPSTKKLCIEVTKGAFTYPKDLTTPIILCGLGTGISPLFSLIEYRENIIKTNKKAKLGDCLVFIGTRFLRASRKALEKLHDYENRKVITKVYEAISREGKKQHIQDKMKEVDEEIWSVWKNEKAMIFFCGPPNTAVDDMREIMTKLALRKENLTRTDAVSHCSQRKWCIEEF